MSFHTNDYSNNYANDEDKLLYSRIDDALKRCGKNGRTAYIGFLNECQAYCAENYLKSVGYKNYILYGGHKSALRVFLCIYSDSFCKPQLSEFPITTMQFHYRKSDTLSHRDFLGALMALGVKRESIGDIIIGEGEAIVFSEEKISDYLLSQITKIGSVGVRIGVCSDENLDFPQKFEELSLIVSSMRIDNIVEALINSSRTKSADLIKSGLVNVNYLPNQNVSRILSGGDIVSIRKKGKFIITDNFLHTKSGRIRLSVKAFK